MCDIEMFKDLLVVLWVISFRFSFIINWTHKSYELARDDPVQVAILHFLIVFILSWIELLKFIPAMLDCDFESLKAVKHLKFISPRDILTVHS